MRISSGGLALIQRFEGYRATAYMDAAGLLTIGYGHRIIPGESFSQGIDGAIASALLQQDVQRAEQAVMRSITRPLTQYQFDALVCFTYNLGSGTLQRSTLRQVVNRGEDAAVPRQLLRYVWAGGRRVSGLIARRRAEELLYFNDNFANIS